MFYLEFRMDASTRFDTNLVGAMPVIVSYFDRVGFSQVIKDIVPWEGEVPLGELIEIYHDAQPLAQSQSDVPDRRMGRQSFGNGVLWTHVRATQ